MEINQLKQLEKEVVQIAKEVGHFIEEQSRNADLRIETKSENSFVTFVDKEAEIRLVSKLKDLIPEAGFITEEETVEQFNATYQWIIDPIDGTTNFIQGIPFYSTSIGLKFQNQIVLGVVNLIPLEQTFHAVRGNGAFLNNMPISVSERKHLSDCIIATGFPYEREQINTAFGIRIKNFLANVRGMRRLGSAALDLAFVASGRMDGYFETTLNPWDVAAGILLVQEAGGQISDYKNEDNYHNGSSIVATNGKVHEALLKLL